jgi:hypothetical protein
MSRVAAVTLAGPAGTEVRTSELTDNNVLYWTTQGHPAGPNHWPEPALTRENTRFRWSNRPLEPVDTRTPPENTHIL